MGQWFKKNVGRHTVNDNNNNITNKLNLYSTFNTGGAVQSAFITWHGSQIETKHKKFNLGQTINAIQVTKGGTKGYE